MLEIYHKEGIPIDQQRLIAHGKYLDKGTNLRTLNDQGCFNKALHLVLKQKGC